MQRIDARAGAGGARGAHVPAGGRKYPNRPERKARVWTRYLVVATSALRSLRKLCALPCMRLYLHHEAQPEFTLIFTCTDKNATIAALKQVRLNLDRSRLLA